MSCPAWCTTQSDDCTEHWGAPGSPSWPEIPVTGDVEIYGELIVSPYPRWGEGDGLEPFVVVWMNGDQIDEDIALIPSEARAMADQLIRAADAVESTIRSAAVSGKA